MVQKQVKLSSLRLVIKMENLSRVSLTWRSMLLVLVHLMLSFRPNILKQVNQLLYRRFYKNREFQIMRLPDHPNVVPLKNCYKNEVYLNVFVEYVPETVYRMSRHYVRMN